MIISARMFRSLEFAIGLAIGFIVAKITSHGQTSLPDDMTRCQLVDADPNPVLSSRLEATEAKYWTHHQIFDCDNMHKLRLVKELGHGHFKRTFLGEYGDDGTKVAVKVPTKPDHCLAVEDKRDRFRCVRAHIEKFTKEVMYLQQLQHPNIIELLGFCMRNELLDAPTPMESGMIAVFEYGDEVSMDDLMSVPFHARLRIAIEIIDLLIYLENSPLGSLKMRDVKPKHLLSVEGKLKLIDVDAMTSLEMPCPRPNDPPNKTIERMVWLLGTTMPTDCQYGTTCQEGICKGYNARRNMVLVDEVWMKTILAIDGLKDDPLFMRKEKSDRSAIFAEVSDVLGSVREHMDDPSNADKHFVKKALQDIQARLAE